MLCGPIVSYVCAATMQVAAGGTSNSSAEGITAPPRRYTAGGTLSVMLPIGSVINFPFGPDSRRRYAYQSERYVGSFTTARVISVSLKPQRAIAGPAIKTGIARRANVDISTPAD